MAVGSNQTGDIPVRNHCIPTVAEIVAKAESLVPALRERAAAAEAERRISDETVADFIAAGFFKILQPPRFGGYGLTHDVAVEVVQTIAQGCGSSGWLVNLIIMHNWQLGLLSLEAQEEIWGEAPETFVATGSFATHSELRPAEGGFRLSGRWKFCSGTDFADWFMIMKPSATVSDWMLVRRSDVEIIDDWYVSGLRATGSKDIVLNDAFVPWHRVGNFDDVMSGNAPGSSIPNGISSGKLPFLDAVIFGIPAAIIGMTKGLTDAFEQSMVGKRSIISGQSQVERVANQCKLAEASADVDTALAVMRHRVAQQREWGRSALPECPAERLAPRRDAAYVAQMLVRTATRLSIAAGASATYQKSPIQRFVRDIMTAGTHATVAWDDIAEEWGRARWALPDAPSKSP